MPMTIIFGKHLSQVEKPRDYRGVTKLSYSFNISLFLSQSSPETA